MRYSVGAKLLISLIIFVPIVVIWLLCAGHSPAQRWPGINNKISCVADQPFEAHSLNELDGKINEIVSSQRIGRAALCITRPRVGEWYIYDKQGNDK